MTSTTQKRIEGLHQDREGLCRTGAILYDGGLYHDRDGTIYEPDGTQHVAGWYGQEGEWQRLRADNGFTFLVRP